MAPEVILALELAGLAGMGVFGWLGTSFVGRITGLLDRTAERLDHVATQVADLGGRLAALERDRP